MEGTKHARYHVSIFGRIEISKLFSVVSDTESKAICSRETYVQTKRDDN